MLPNTNYKQDEIDLLDQYVTRDQVITSGMGLWAIGSNNQGMLGTANGDELTRTTFTQISNVPGWTLYSLREGFFVKRNDGEMFCWGANVSGNLGLAGGGGKRTPTYFPSAKAGETTTIKWATIAGDAGACFGIDTSGRAFCWGSGDNGVLGLGNTLSQETPVQLGALTDWKYITSIGDAVNTSCSAFAIKTNGTLWSWGFNDVGQLGNGNRTSRSSPVQVGALTNWKQIAASQKTVFAVKTDGTLWSWGGNDFGILAAPGVTSRSSPVQVGTMTNWSKVMIRGYQGFAIKTDGTMWAWGWSTTGQLGLGAGNFTLDSPVQVGSDTNWYDVIPQGDTTMAIKTDGTLWGCGASTRGALQRPHGTNVPTFTKLSPPTVGGLVTGCIASGQYYNDGSATFLISGEKY